jgi:hypothetical protein
MEVKYRKIFISYGAEFILEKDALMHELEKTIEKKNIRLNELVTYEIMEINHSKLKKLRQQVKSSITTVCKLESRIDKLIKEDLIPF